jgi:opacity protein-like surface antigen
MPARWTVQVATLVLAFVLGAGAACAQNYDGTGLVKFGVFGQGTFIDIGVSEPFIGSASPSGFSGGVSAGYDLVAPGRWLLGVEIDGSFGDARERANNTDFGFDYAMSIRARAGLFPSHNVQLYGTAGVGYLGLEIQEPGIGRKQMETLTGFVGGAGMEFDVGRFILFSEYLYGSYGSRSFNIANVRHTIDDVQTHMVRLGFKFKVGHDYAHELDRSYGRYGTLK